MVIERDLADLTLIWLASGNASLVLGGFANNGCPWYQLCQVRVFGGQTKSRVGNRGLCTRNQGAATAGR